MTGNMNKRSKYRNGLILALNDKWTTETKLEVELKDVFDLSDMADPNGLVKCRGKWHSEAQWTMHDYGSTPSKCQWRLTKSGLAEKKYLEKEGWYLG